MRVLLQRVREARVEVADQIVGAIERGYLLLVGVAPGDDETIARKLASKVAGLRLFPDAQGRFDQALADVGGGALVVSQFTLFADARKGRRPNFGGAARPELAEPLCRRFAELLREAGVDPVAEGRFAADMQVTLINDGPVTLMLDSDELERPRRGSAP